MRSTSADNTIIPKQDFLWSDHQASKLFRKRWFYHSLFWLIYYVFFCIIVVFGIYHIYDLTFYAQLILFFPLDIALVYFNFYVLIPRLLLQGKYYYYALSLTISLTVSAALNLLLKQAYTNLGSQLYAVTAGFTFGNVMGTIIERFYLLGLTMAIKLAKDWIQNQQRIKEREKQYLETELNFLKSQIQPHFFFNTLNNLYSLTLKKSDKAPDVVLKLAELMSYMLYESNTQKVALNKEITYLQNYLDLEELRFGQRLSTIFKIEGRTEEIYIPPLILILFIENSFKHGVKNIVEKIEIEIWLKVEDGYLYFQVKNPVEENIISTKTIGIGLKNVKRRLDLLYGNNYKLNEVKEEKEYTVSLKIPV